MYFHRHLLKPEGGAYEVILIMKPYLALEEFADEFGFTEKAEEDINRVAVGYVKKKFPNLKVKTIKVMMSGALVTSIMVTGGMTPVFANELDGEAQVETNNNPDIQPETATSDEPIETETSPTDEATTTNSIEEEPEEVPIVEELITDDTKSEEVPLDEPGLVPGDFFTLWKSLPKKYS
ncbi:hypothetical protein [Ornithinibacillus scapharcae]|uniref:hypothetical protein n=1 Tax=Ornithinibacillus scapharcae TaxID=1147159 RepID=UPI000225BD36|nr:hypothetical protein [Ornithinibacillus scapharcae]